MARMRLPALFGIALAALAAGCSMLGSPRTVGPALTGEQIKKLVTGNTIQGPLGPAVYDWYYADDGKVSGDVGYADNDSGKWHIKGANTYCHQWQKFFDGAERCYQWYKLDRSGQYLMKNVDSEGHEDIKVFEVIVGNPYSM